jgi:steroid 5-alpha reductase family enzyme
MMNVLTVALSGLGAGLGLAVATWLASLPRRDVTIVDSMWPWLVWLPVAVIALLATGPAPRGLLVLALAGLWALRLSLHIAWRHRGQLEDRRYQAIRRRNQPNFEWKSLYLVFGLQAVLAWIVALPLMAMVSVPAPWHPLDAVGAALFLAGLGIETVADAQLTRFRADPAQQGRVMDRGLWRYSRHPNYFGECLLWWGLWVMAVAAGAWWTLPAPLLMTWLLLKVSGVTLLEADLVGRRPGYADYVRRTSAFLPRRPRA